MNIETNNTRIQSIYAPPAFDKKRLACQVGALLYSPATNHKIAEAILSNKFGRLTSVALCLEDAINDMAVAEAEDQIVKTFMALYQQQKTACTPIKLPQIYIRVRQPQQITTLFRRLENYQQLLSGFIFPKYSLETAAAYSGQLLKINAVSQHRIYMMPILESPDLIDLQTRRNTLLSLKEQLDSVAAYVLNVRVGGNDFCKDFGLRRHIDQSIYDMLPISAILSDILTVFSRDYVVSGPVWEYFDSANGEWEKGLRREMKQDRLNGFIGKTVIHPNQVPVVLDAMRVHRQDYEDALAILSFQNDLVQVAKNNSGQRMNEVKTHTKWAEQTLLLAQIYGVKA